MAFGLFRARMVQTENTEPIDAARPTVTRESDAEYEFGIDETESEPDYVSEYVIDLGRPDVEIEYDESDLNPDWTIRS